MNTIRFVEIPRADCRVVGTNVVLTLVVSKVFFPRIVFYFEFPLFNCICNPKKLISIDPERCRLMVLFAIPIAVELLQCTIVGVVGVPFLLA